MNSQHFVRRLRNCGTLLLVGVFIQVIQSFNVLAKYLPTSIGWLSVVLASGGLRRHSRVASITFRWSIAMLVFSLSMTLLGKVSYTVDVDDAMEWGAQALAAEAVLNVACHLAMLATLFWVSKLAAELAEPVDFADESGLQSKVTRSFHRWLLAIIGLMIFRLALLISLAAWPHTMIKWLTQISPRMLILPKLAADFLGWFAVVNCFVVASAYHYFSDRLAIEPLKFQVVEE